MGQSKEIGKFRNLEDEGVCLLPLDDDAGTVEAHEFCLPRTRDSGHDGSDSPEEGRMTKDMKREREGENDQNNW